MRVHYEASGNRTTFEKFLTCLNRQCKHVFVASLFGPFLEGPFAVRDIEKKREILQAAKRDGNRLATEITGVPSFDRNTHCN
jgi:hypothetical protein